MKSILATLSFAAVAFAHGIVTDMRIDGEYWHSLYNPYKSYGTDRPDTAGWTMQNNGPVKDVNSPAIACNSGSKNGTYFAHAEAGAKVTFFWTEWQESHKGPVMTYLAPVNGEEVNELDFFKIDHAGLNKDGTWATDDIRKNNNSYTVTVPKDLKAGLYVLRHELLALHEANKPNGAQFYPVCINLEVSGFGSAVPKDTCKFPGGYKADDAGILFNMYTTPAPTHYPIPGPPPYKSKPMGFLDGFGGGFGSFPSFPNPFAKPHPEVSALPVSSGFHTSTRTVLQTVPGADATETAFTVTHTPVVTTTVQPPCMTKTVTKNVQNTVTVTKPAEVKTVVKTVEETKTETTTPAPVYTVETKVVTVVETKTVKKEEAQTAAPVPTSTPAPPAGRYQR
ncbi:glycosyl hydrolase family 61-domain-containing protein, partial [Pyronema domesticum]